MAIASNLCEIVMLFRWSNIQIHRDIHMCDKGHNIIIQEHI